MFGQMTGASVSVDGGTLVRTNIILREPSRP